MGRARRRVGYENLVPTRGPEWKRLGCRGAAPRNRVSHSGRLKAVLSPKAGSTQDADKVKGSQEKEEEEPGRRSRLRTFEPMIPWRAQCGPVGGVTG